MFYSYDFFVSRIFSIILNKGGMSDVAKAYLDYFEQPRDAYLFVFYDMRIFYPPEKEGVIFFNDPNLYNFSKSEQLEKLSACVAQKVQEIGGKQVVCDFHTFRYFKGLPVEIIADVHYLIKYANCIARPQHALYQEDIPLRFQLRFSREEALKGKLEQEMLKSSLKIIANSNYTKSLLESYYKIESDKITTVPVGDVLDSPQVKINLENTSRSILYHGRFNIHKRVDYLIDLGQKIENELILCGATESTKIKAEALSGSKTSVELWQTDINKKIQQSLFHIFPSHYEPWGLALTKSMQAGGICIANERGKGHCEQIDHGDNGFLIDFSKEDWVRNVEAILNLNESEISRISQAAMNKAVMLTSSNYCENVFNSI